MKKIVFLLIIGWMSVSAGYAQLPVKFYDENCAVSKNILETLEFQNDSIRTQLSAGFYGGDQTISLGSSTMLELRFEGDGPIDFSYSDGQYVFIVDSVYTSPFFFEVRPMTQTTYQLRKVRNASGFGHIQEGHECVTVYVGNGNMVQTNFLPPDYLCENASPIDLRNYFTSNVTGTVSFKGDGVIGNTFYPQEAGVGSHYIVASLSYNNSIYSVGRNINVNSMPQVTLWLPNEVFVTDPPFVLSGGRPSGGAYSTDLGDYCIVNGNTFYPQRAGVGWHNVYYTYTTIAGCQDVAQGRIYVRSVGFGVDEYLEETGISVYPNPTTGMVNFGIRVDDSESYTSEPCSVDVFSVYGVLVLRNNSLQEGVDLSSLPAGIYMLRLYNGKDHFSRTVIKK